MKITSIPIVFTILASALIIPVGISYAAYDNSPAFTPSTNTNMTMTTTNQTDTNMTMTTTNQTNTNMTMTTTNQTGTNMTATSTPSENQPNTSMPSAPLDPLKQFKSGVTAKDVKCESGFSLVLKAEDGSPACVHSSSVQILIQLGWAAPQ